jgi:hypothetical protein
MKVHKIEKLVYPVYELTPHMKELTDFESCQICGSHLIYIDVGYGAVKFPNSDGMGIVMAIELHMICAECGSCVSLYTLQEEKDIIRKFSCKDEADEYSTLVYDKRRKKVFEKLKPKRKSSSGRTSR